MAWGATVSKGLVSLYLMKAAHTSYSCHIGLAIFITILVPDNGLSHTAMTKGFPDAYSKARWKASNEHREHSETNGRTQWTTPFTHSSVSEIGRRGCSPKKNGNENFGRPMTGIGLYRHRIGS